MQFHSLSSVDDIADQINDIESCQELIAQLCYKNFMPTILEECSVHIGLEYEQFNEVYDEFFIKTNGESEINHYQENLNTLLRTIGFFQFTEECLSESVKATLIS